MTLQEIEKALAEGRIWAKMYDGRLWVVRRTGKTRTWVTRPGKFRIPVKAGFRSTGYIDHNNYASNFVIKD